MPRPSTIDQLPAEIRDLIGSLRDQGRTIDQILEKLRELDVGVSRSALGRHVQQLDAIGEELRRSRAIAEALVRQLGEAPESRTARLNIELMHSQVMKLLVSEEGEGVKLDPQEVMFLARSLQQLAAAAKTDQERVLRIQAEVAKKNAAALGEALEQAEAAGERGLSAERVKQLREEFLGVRNA